MAVQVKNDNVLIGHINELDSRLDIVENEFDNYLPLTGGDLTGPVTSSSNITASGGFIGNFGEEQLNNTNIKNWVDTASNIHTTGKQGEIMVKRFFSSADESVYSSSYDLPVVDSHNLIFSIDNSTQWQRIVSLDMRTNDIWTIGKSGNIWRDWQKLAFEGNYSYNNAWNISSSTGELTTSLSITTHGRPVFIAFSWDMQGTAAGQWCTGAVYRGDTQLKARTTVCAASSYNESGVITYLDIVEAGSYTYNFKLKVGSGTITYNETNLYGNEQPSLCIFEI